jgi:DNA-binding XRE family transcriptional regulator
MGRPRKDTSPRPDFADALIRARKAAGYRSQSALAAAIGYAQQTINQWETGKVRPPFNAAVALADKLNIPLGLLLPAEARAVFEEQAAIATVAESDRAFGVLAQRVFDAMVEAGTRPSVAIAAQLSRAIWRMAGGEDAVLPGAAAIESHIHNIRELWRDVVAAARAD